MPIITVGKSDIGMKRKSNQDSICLNDKWHFFAVADGMGGHNGGDIASQLSVKIFPEFVENHQNDDPKIMMRDCVKKANEEIFKKAAREEDLKGMGTTVTAICYKGQHLYLANVGDSRVYLVQHGKLYQMTRDHSLIQEKLNMGIYGREAAVKDRMKNVLVRSVGFEEQVEVDVFNYKICRNDIFLLCSDGLHGKVADSHILSIINHYIPSPDIARREDLDKTASALIDQANANGGEDNISVIISLAQ